MSGIKPDIFLREAQVEEIIIEHLCHLKQQTYSVSPVLTTFPKTYECCTFDKKSIL